MTRIGGFRDLPDPQGLDTRRTEGEKNETASGDPRRADTGERRRSVR